MKTREPATVSDTYTFREGHPGWYDARAYPVEEGIFVIITDVTERRQAEQMVEWARDESIRASAAKSRFLSAASHDLRQPLQALALLGGVLEEASSDPQVLEIARQQHGTVKMMQGMLDGLLDLSQIESGTIKVHAIHFPVEELLHRIRQDFMLKAQHKGLELRVAPCALSIHSDPALLARVVNNFVANAINFTLTGKVLVGCRRRGELLRIEVWDTGVGIPQDKLGSAFEAFYQIDNPARDAEKGFGLGLSVAWEMAKLLGHKLDTRSSAGNGSMFAVEVPLGKGSIAQPSAATEGIATGKPRAGALVLLVEDNPLVQQTMCIMLESMGLRVITALSGEQALEQLQAHASSPDMIIADYRLPEGCSGVEVIHRVRELAGDLIPAALVTGEISPEGLKEMESSDCEIFYKPTDIVALKAWIGRALE